jgi:hypothetical protein
MALHALFDPFNVEKAIATHNHKKANTYEYGLNAPKPGHSAALLVPRVASTPGTDVACVHH